MYRDNYPNDIESPQKLFIQYSHDITFDYSTGRWPTGNETDFDWEDYYIPQDHTYNGRTVGPHVWRRERLGLNGLWSYPQPFAINNANIEAFANGSISYFDQRYYTKTDLETNLINIAGDQLDVRYYTQEDIENNFITIVGDQLDERYYTKTYLENNLLEIAGTQLDGRYFARTEFLSVSAGATDSGEPIVLDADGNIDASMINDADISHLNITDIGTNSHASIDSHIADTSIHFTEASIDHTALLNIGTNSHTLIDSHIADATIHFTEASISHLNIQDIGVNSHTTIDSHIADSTIHFTEASIDHANILNIGVNTHAQIDTHIADSTIHFTETSIDHGSIAGLGDDDHSIYHTDVRGDARYYTQTNLQTSGQSNVHWNNITNTPATYPPSAHTHENLTPGDGITGSVYNAGTARTFSVDFAGSGLAITAARSDHNHYDTLGLLTNGTGWTVTMGIYKEDGWGAHSTCRIVGKIDKNTPGDDMYDGEIIAMLASGFRPTIRAVIQGLVYHTGGIRVVRHFVINSAGNLYYKGSNCALVEYIEFNIYYNVPI